MRIVSSIVLVAALAGSGRAAPAPLLPPPAHLAAFHAAWSEARACLLARPRPHDHDDASCAAAVDKALAVARAADADPGYHVAWWRVAARVGAISRRLAVRSSYGVGTGDLALVDAAEAQLRAAAGAPGALPAEDGDE
jgi:hypothetical protein